MTKNKPGYSDALAELEAIVAEIENEEVEMDNLLEKVQRASFLIQHCRKQLRNMESEVKKTLAEIDVEKEDVSAN